MARMVKWFSRRRSRLRLKEAPDPRKSSDITCLIPSFFFLVSDNPKFNRFSILNASYYPTSDRSGKQSASPLARTSKNLGNITGTQWCQ